MKWFGPAPFSATSLDAAVERVPVPLAFCAECEAPFAEDDCGYLIPHLTGGLFPSERAYHVDCFMSLILPPDHPARRAQ